MKKKNLKSLQLSKKTISNFKLHTLQGAGEKRSERLLGNCAFSRRNPAGPLDDGFCAHGFMGIF